MEIIRYFCIVKRFNWFLRTFLRTLCLAVFVFLTASAHADENSAQQQHMDSVKISLLTCSPGSEVWSLYGHTAIRLQDLRTNEDVVINYGLFNFSQSNFILRFVFGLTDYEMGIVPYQMFLMEYAREGRSVVQQDLNLSPADKASIVQALYENYLPQNRVYRYNFFYDNCTSRARDIIANNMRERITYTVNPNTKTSFRDMIHQWNGSHRWARFGNDLLLGLKADAETDYKDQQFLPDSLRKDFGEAMVIEKDSYVSAKHPLVSSTQEILKANPLNAQVQPSIWDTITPTILFGLLFLVIAVLTLWELKRKKTFWLLDVTLLTLDGMAGLVLFAMIFSQHPTVSLNLQILLLNPLSIMFVYSVANHSIKQRYHWYWTILFACLILFMIGAIFQHYAEGMIILALILLVRIGSNYYINKQLPTKS